MAETEKVCLLLMCHLNDLSIHQLLTNTDEQLCHSRHMRNNLCVERASQGSLVCLDCIALRGKLCYAVQKNFLRAFDFCLESIDDDRWVRELFSRTILRDFSFVGSGMSVRSDSLEETRIQSSRRSECIGGRRWRIHSLLLLLLPLFAAVADLNWTLGRTSHVRATAICTLNSVRTVSIVFMMVAAFEAFRLVHTVDSFVTELLTSKAAVKSSQWFVGDCGISYAVNEYMSAVDNGLHIFI